MTILKTWFDNEIYNKQFELGFYECDYNKKIKLSTILAMASDTAGKDYTERGISHNKMLEAKEVMLLARYHIHINRLPIVDEVLTVRTWENGVVGGYAIREYEFFDSDENACILISSSWVIVNPETKRIVRPKHFTCKELNPEHISTSCEIPDKISIENESLEYYRSHRVLYSELDGNGHMNNSNYGNIIYDTLCSLGINIDTCDIQISYNKEAKVNDEIKIYGYNQDNSTYIVGKIEDNVSFLCKII